MIHSSPLRVKAAVREQHGASRTIPFAFRADPIGLDGVKLTRTARAVFALVLDNARGRGWRSRLSNSTMARVLDCCTMTIKRALADLEAAGLVLREMLAGGRIRSGILVTWPGVEQECSTGRMHLEQARSTGGTSVFQGVEQARSTNQSSTTSEDQTAPILPLVEDPGTPPDPATAAAYLKACIEAGRRGVEPPPPPHMRTEPAAPPPSGGTPPSGPALDSPRREVRVMLDQLAANFTTRQPGPRRLSPAELQRQLAEVRRRHGAGKAQPRC